MANLSTRNVLTFCLAIATMVQPMSVIAFSASCCGQRRPSAVQPSRVGGESCGCCDVAEENSVAKASGCCCESHREEKPTTNDRSDSSDDQSSDDQSNERAWVAVVADHCFCSTVTPPMSQGESRDVSAREWIGRLVFWESSQHGARPVVNFRVGALDRMPGNRDDSCQRFLCVWRI